MNRAGVTTMADGNIPQELRDQLARCERTLGAVAPMLQHLVGHSDHSLYHEEVIARVRGMLDHLAEQLARAFQEPQGLSPNEPIDLALLDPLSQALADNSALLTHLHALAIEWQLSTMLETERKVDPVLTPVVQGLVASDEPETASAAMSFLAAQSRYTQAMRRMQLPLDDLPANLLHAALTAMRKLLGQRADLRRHAQTAIRHVQEGYDEARTRLGLASAIMLTRDARISARDPQSAGIALFCTALALETEQDRDAVVLTASAGTGPRLALLLRAAGASQEETERAVLALHKDAELPDGLAATDRHTALSLFGKTAGGAGS